MYTLWYTISVRGTDSYSRVVVQERPLRALERPLSPQE